MITLSKRIVATVCYADIFDYPLTSEELSTWLIGKPGVLPKTVEDFEEKNTRTGTYYFLKRRKEILRKRKMRASVSEEKWKLAHSFARFFKLVPTILLVGVTGGLSMNNADKGDDIDLFFVTSRGTLWVSRAVVTLLSDILGIRRKPGDRSFTDKICLNMFMSEDSLSLPARERDLFSAHEVLQLRVLWSRGDTYARFLTANNWVRRFLPTAWEERQAVKTKIIRKSLFSGLVWWILTWFESISRKYQLRYMEPRRTSEVITPGFIRFHPSDARVWIKKKLEKRLKRFNIPLDSIFHHP